MWGSGQTEKEHTLGKPLVQWEEERGALLSLHLDGCNFQPLLHARGEGQHFEKHFYLRPEEKS